MIELPIAVLFICLLIVALAKHPWGGLLLMAVFVAVLLPTFIKLWEDPSRNFTAVYASLAACMWGTAIGRIVVVLRANVPQLNLARTNHLEKWALLGGVLFALYGVGALGYSIGLEMAFSYAQHDKLLIIDAKISEAVAAASFYLGMAVAMGLSALVSAMTSKGLRVSSNYLVTWNQIGSYEWQGNKLVLHLNGKILPARFFRVPVEVAPTQREAVNQLLEQHLPNLQVQSSPPAPAAA